MFINSVYLLIVLLLFICIYLSNGPPRWYSGKESNCQCRRCKRLRFYPGVRKILWRRKWKSTPVFLPGESHGQRSLVGYSPWGCKELDTTELLSAYTYIHTHTHTHTHSHTHLFQYFKSEEDFGCLKQNNRHYIKIY